VIVPLLLAFIRSKELLQEEFPQPIVEEQLVRYKIFPPRSGRIARELARRSRDVDSLTQKWIEEMGGNIAPLVAGNLRKKAAYQIYREVLVEAGIEDPTTTYELYESILETKAECQRQLGIENR